MTTGMIVPKYLPEVQSAKLTTKSTKPKSLYEHVSKPKGKNRNVRNISYCYIYLGFFSKTTAGPINKS